MIWEERRLTLAFGGWSYQKHPDGLSAPALVELLKDSMGHVQHRFLVLVEY